MLCTVPDIFSGNADICLLNISDALRSPAVENINSIFTHYGDFLTNSLETLEAPENMVAGSMEFSSFDDDTSSLNIASNESTICHGSDIVSDVSDRCSVIPHYMKGGDAYFVFEESKEDGVVEFPTESACSSSGIIFNPLDGTDSRSVPQLSMTDFSDVEQHHLVGEENGHLLPACGKFSYVANRGLFDDKGSVQQFNHSQLFISNNKQAICVKNEDNTLISSGNIFRHPVGALDEASWRKPIDRFDDSLSVDEDSKQSSNISPYISNQKFMVNDKDSHHCYQDILNVSIPSSLHRGHLNLTSSEPFLSTSHPITSTKMQLGCFGDEREGKLNPSRSMCLSKVSHESIHSNLLDCRSHADDDPDICILEDISQPARSNQSLVLVKNTSSLPNTTFSNPLHNSGMGGIRLKGNDERLIFRAALQVSAVCLRLFCSCF